METIKRPNWFTKKKYLEYKSRGMTDREIREKVLFVSFKVMLRFKEELGVVGVGNRGGQNKACNDEIVKRMYRAGYRVKDICERYGCDRSSVYRALER